MALKTRKIEDWVKCFPGPNAKRSIRRKRIQLPVDGYAAISEEGFVPRSSGRKFSKTETMPGCNKAFMRQKGCNFSRWSCKTLPHPKQQDGTSCGIFALKFAEFVLRKDPIVLINTKEGVEDLRKEIAVTLLLNSDDLSQLCHVCGEKSGDNNWIVCDCCNRWYHQSCIQVTSQVHFLCHTCQT